MRRSRRYFLYSLGSTGLASGSAGLASSLLLEHGTARVTGRLSLGKPILLDRNENAYGTSVNVQASMQSALRLSNRYPRAAYDAAVHEIASFHSLKPNQILVGCGSTDIMRMCANAFLTPRARLLTGDPTFRVMQECARQVGSQVLRIPLNHRHEHDLARMLDRIDPTTHLVYICNPNNPTGTITPKEELEGFLAEVPSHTHVLLDEAYHEYAGDSRDYASFLERATIDPHLVVTRTFSKLYGLAGLRVGYAIGTENTIRHIRRYLLWSGLNIAAAYACSAAVKDKEFVLLSTKRNRNDRQEFFNQAQTRSLKPLASHTNFFFIDVGRAATSVIAHFEKHNILVGPEVPSMDTFVRVTLGLPEEMREFWRVWDLLPPGKMRM